MMVLDEITVGATIEEKTYSAIEVTEEKPKAFPWQWLALGGALAAIIVVSKKKKT
jgi:hypothetical protein